MASELPTEVPAELPEESVAGALVSAALDTAADVAGDELSAVVLELPQAASVIAATPMAAISRSRCLRELVLRVRLLVLMIDTDGTAFLGKRVGLVTGAGRTESAKPRP